MPPLTAALKNFNFKLRRSAYVTYPTFVPSGQGSCAANPTQISTLPIRTPSTTSSVKFIEQNQSPWPVRASKFRRIARSEANPFHRVKEQLPAQPAGEGAPQRVSPTERTRPTSNLLTIYSIKKPKTLKYPSLKGTDPKFRRNHRHALHGNMKALVRFPPLDRALPA